MQCPWNCGIEVQRKYLEYKRKNEIFNLNDTVHNCNQRQEARGKFISLKDKEKRDKEIEEENKRKLMREPRYTYFKNVKELKDPQYMTEPKSYKGFTIPICECNEADIFPIFKESPQYYFDTQDCIRIDYLYYCGNCGGRLAARTIDHYFPNEN